MTKPKLIIFDVDGVLLQGYEFSWKLLWQHLHYDDSIRKSGFSMYLDKELSYQDWCNWCLKYFKEKNLSYLDIKKISEKISIDSSLFELLDYCKKKDMFLGIVSGGIDTFLEIVIPNISTYFDKENIFINHFNFDPDNKLDSIKATKYDFDQKLDAIKNIASKYSISLSEVMFLGDNINDIEALKKVGFSVAFNTNIASVKSVSNYSCKNFKEVLEILK